MKSLVESLFDKDLVSKKTSAENEIEHFRNKDIAKMSSEDIIAKIHSIMNSCDVYTYNELKKHPVDLLKRVIIIPEFSGAEVGDYKFVYSKDIPNWGIESNYAYINKGTRNWSWKTCSWRDLDRFKGWDKKVDFMGSVFLGSNIRTFYVIPEGLSKDLIKAMSGK